MRCPRDPLYQLDCSSRPSFGSTVISGVLKDQPKTPAKLPSNAAGFPLTRVRMRSLKAAVKYLLPERALSLYRNARLWCDMARAQGKSKKEIFVDIYKNNQWGGVPGTFSSGSGSRADVNASYIA